MSRVVASPPTMTLAPKLTVEEVMTITRMSRSQVYQLAKDRTIRAIRLRNHRRVLFDPDDVRRYLQDGVAV